MVDIANLAISNQIINIKDFGKNVNLKYLLDFDHTTVFALHMHCINVAGKRYWYQMKTPPLHPTVRCPSLVECCWSLRPCLFRIS